MTRPTLLVAEEEPKQALSVRKLVLETAKFNVLTAHSNHEATEVFRLFPNVSLAVLVSGGPVDCDAIARHIKSFTDKVPVIVLTPRIGGVCKHADHSLPSDEPESLLELVRSLLGDPR
jgi:DNA-binding response OmpR family regulator